MEVTSRIVQAIAFIQVWGNIDGGHHKQWVIDQLLRILLANQYDEWIVEYNQTAGDEMEPWDVGTAP